MVWSTTTAVEEFLAEAGEFLRAEPARNSVVLTVAENLRVKVVTASPAAAVSASPAAAAAPGASPGSDRTLLGWWRPGADRGPVGGAFLHTPQFPVFLTAMSRQAAAAFAATWRQRAGGDAQVHRRMRLFRLAELIPPDPRPEGAARLAAEPDRDLLIAWFDAFAREVDDLAGQDHAATAAVSQAARDAGAQEVVLYTDLANPTSNALYQRLGYRPVEDRVVLSYLARQPHDGP